MILNSTQKMKRGVVNMGHVAAKSTVTMLSIWGQEIYIFCILFVYVKSDV